LLTPNEATWESQSISLSAYAGQTISLVWLYNDNSAWSYGLVVDDIVVEASGTVAPSITGFSNTGATGTTVSWDPQSLHEAGGFVIRYHEFGQSPNFSWKIIQDESRTSAYVNGLDDGTRYVFRVGSKCNMAANATYSDTSSVWTKNVCAQPSFYNGSAMSPTTAAPKWGNPDGDNYKMRFRPSGGSWSYRNGVSNYGSDTLSLTNLTPSTTYDWQVRTICDAGGNQPYGPLQSFTTPDAPAERLSSAVTQVGVYPNPTNGNLTIDFNMEESANVSLVLIEMSGRVVSTSNMNAQEGNNRERLDLSDLAPGFYLIRMVDANGVMLINERVSKN
jgi:hypothetical protein